jgi:hypothetical protein
MPSFCFYLGGVCDDCEAGFDVRAGDEAHEAGMNLETGISDFHAITDIGFVHGAGAVSEDAEDDGDGIGTERHCTVLDRGIGYSRDLLAIHFLLEEEDNRVEKFATVLSDVVGQPFIQVEVFSSGCEGGDIERKHKGANFEEGFEDLNNASQKW